MDLQSNFWKQNLLRWLCRDGEGVEGVRAGDIRRTGPEEEAEGRENNERRALRFLVADIGPELWRPSSDFLWHVLEYCSSSPLPNLLLSVSPSIESKNSTGTEASGLHSLFKYFLMCSEAPDFALPQLYFSFEWHISNLGVGSGVKIEFSILVPTSYIERITYTRSWEGCQIIRVRSSW